MKHAMRNAMITPFTVILLQINYLITGVVVVEAVFAYPGFGRMLLDAALYTGRGDGAGGVAVRRVRRRCATQIVGDFGYMLLNPAHPVQLRRPDDMADSRSDKPLAKRRIAGPGCGRISLLRESPVGMIGAFLVLFWIFVAIFAPLLAPYDPNANDYGRADRPAADRRRTGSAPTCRRATSCRASSGARARC